MASIKGQGSGWIEFFEFPKRTLFSTSWVVFPIFNPNVGWMREVCIQQDLSPKYSTWKDFEIQYGESYVVEQFYQIACYMAIKKKVKKMEKVHNGELKQLKLRHA